MFWLSIFADFNPHRVIFTLRHPKINHLDGLFFAPGNKPGAGSVEMSAPDIKICVDGVTLNSHISGKQHVERPDWRVDFVGVKTFQTGKELFGPGCKAINAGAGYRRSG